MSFFFLTGMSENGTIHITTLKNGTVGPRVWIFLSPLDTNNRFYLSHMGNDVEQLFRTAYALVCEKILSPLSYQYADYLALFEQLN